MSTPALNTIHTRLAAAKAARQAAVTKLPGGLPLPVSAAGVAPHPGSRVLDTLTGKECTVRATRTQHSTVPAPAAGH